MDNLLRNITAHSGGLGLPVISCLHVLSALRCSLIEKDSRLPRTTKSPATPKHFRRGSGL